MFVYLCIIIVRIRIRIDTDRCMYVHTYLSRTSLQLPHLELNSATFK